MRVRGSGGGDTRWRRWAVGLALAMAGGLLSVVPAAASTSGSASGATPAAEPVAAVDDDVTVTAGCDNDPTVPDWFYPVLRRAAARPGDGVPDSWGYGDRGRAMMKIICNESSFRVGAYNGADAGPFYGLGQMGRPAIDDARVRFACYWYVNNDCNRKRRYYQCLAALRYANQRYNGPIRAWNHWKANGWW